MYPKRYTVGDILDDMFDRFSSFSPQSNSYSFRGQRVDTDRYDIIPKRAYLEGEITRKEEELRRCEEIQKMILKQKQDEIDSLRNKLIKSKRDEVI